MNWNRCSDRPPTENCDSKIVKKRCAATKVYLMSRNSSRPFPNDQFSQQVTGFPMNDYDLPIDGTGNQTPASVREITPRELARIRPLPVIIDIREEEEFMRGHIDGARQISRTTLERRIREIAPDPTTPIVVYCAVGNRGSLAAEHLQRLGYRKAFSLKGGLQQWLEAGGMVECPKSSSFAGIR
jgi:rhodanese-related sulfurtransferase